MRFNHNRTKATLGAENAPIALARRRVALLLGNAFKFFPEILEFQDGHHKGSPSIIEDQGAAKL